jgi:hypothetical protein
VWIHASKPVKYVAVLAIWHIMQHVKDQIAFLDLLSVLDLMLRI